jgi:hypothetical protein
MVGPSDNTAGIRDSPRQPTAPRSQGVRRAGRGRERPGYGARIRTGSGAAVPLIGTARGTQRSGRGRRRPAGSPKDPPSRSAWRPCPPSPKATGWTSTQRSPARDNSIRTGSQSVSGAYPSRPSAVRQQSRSLASMARSRSRCGRVCRPARAATPHPPPTQCRTPASSSASRTWMTSIASTGPQLSAASTSRASVRSAG